MAFTVINTVKGTKEEIPLVVMEVQRLGIDAVRHQPGFRSSRLLVSEDGTEAMLLIEWESREHFVAYRQSEVGQKLVQQAMKLHPHIAFYEVIASSES